MKQCEILLINPPVYDFVAYDLWARPLGLLYIAEILRQNNCRITLIDCMDRTSPNMPAAKNGKFGCGHYHSTTIPKPPELSKIPRTYRRFGLPRQTFQQLLLNCTTPQAILVTSTMTYWYPGVIEAIQLARAQFPNTPVILGGTYATLCTDHARQHTGADHVITGHRIEPLISALRSIGLPMQCSTIPETFNEFPVPAYDLYPTLPSAAIRTSIGCPWHCSYCAIGQLSSGYQCKEPLTVDNEIASLVQRGATDIALYDDALLYNAKEHILPLLYRIHNHHHNLRLHTPNGLHSKYVSHDTASAMKSANFVMPRLSLETAHAKQQATTGGKVTNAQFETAIQNLRSAGYRPGEYAAYLMMGMPNQSFEEVETTIHYAHAHGAHISLGEYSPIPGTRDWETITHRLPSDDPLWHNNSLMPMHSLTEWPMIQKLKDLTRMLNKKLAGKAK